MPIYVSLFQADINRPCNFAVGIKFEVCENERQNENLGIVLESEELCSKFFYFKFRDLDLLKTKRDKTSNATDALYKANYKLSMTTYIGIQVHTRYVR